MPRKQTHQVVGGLGGAAYALVRSPNEGDLLLVEAIGGAGGGVLGGGWPDVIEPAICGSHRKTAHSLFAGAYMVGVSEEIEKLAARLRGFAAEQLAIADSTTAVAPDERIGARILAILALLLAGFLNGIVAGYVSHLVLDGLTPAGLPIC